jgi:L-ascorbate metabolism protein UlaG (beta-lactamase superfamily)
MSSHKIGLLPQPGWQERNLHFLREILLPHIFLARKGQTLAPPDHPTAPDGVGVTWVGHATCLVQVAGLSILIDPNWALWHGPVKRLRQPGLHLDQLPEIDLVLVSHAHHDHLNLSSLRQVARSQPIVTAAGVGPIIRGLGFRPVVELDTWQSFSFRDCRITLTPARHWGARFLHDTHRGFGGFLIEAAGRRIYHAGDTSFFNGFEDIASRLAPELALFPIGAYGAPSGRPVHIDPEEALEAHSILGTTRLVPIHYATFPLGTEPIDEPVERLHVAAARRGITDQIIVLPEGRQAIL